MSQLILESEDVHELELIKQLAEKLSIHYCLILQKTKPVCANQDDIHEARHFVEAYSQENTSFGDVLAWQKIERQERPLR